MGSKTEELASFVAALRFEDLPAEVVERTRCLIMDHIGVALRARHAAELNEAMQKGLASLGFTGGSSCVIGDATGYAPAAAAFYNGSLAHSLDFDDTHARGSIHPSAPIVPAAFAAAEIAGANGRQLITAIIAGYEVQIRLSLALGPTQHYERGFHPTATCGVFGAAAAACQIFRASTNQVENAFGLCGSQSAGSLKFLADGAWNKPFHTGYAAMSGLIAATLAREGFAGAAECLEGERGGFLPAYSPDPNPEELTSGLGRLFETLQIAVKPYPSCRYGHAALDALLGLRETHHLDTADIESVEVGLPATGWKLIGDPASEKQRPRNYVDGQFSMPFVAAVALREGRLSWDDYSRHLNDPDTLALCRKVHTVIDERVEAEFPANMGGVARIVTAGGTFEELVVIPKGEPANFLSQEEMRAKFDTLTSPYLDLKSRDTLVAALRALPELMEVGAILPMTRPSS